MPDRQIAREMLRQQRAELESIFEHAQQDLNAVRGSERVRQWKARTVTLLAEHLGREAAQRLAGRQAGPSFSQDLLEELADEVETYRTCLLELERQLTVEST
jgi:F0F1-type ATP synthase membrane subunit b/b'